VIAEPFVHVAAPAPDEPAIGDTAAGAANLSASAVPLAIRADLLWLPKAGNTVDEYEDAWAISPDDDPSSGHFACAVTDGATETSFAGLWARLLAEAYCAGGTTPAALFAALPAAQAAWREAVAAIPLPWYAEEKARQGAFAALVGLSLVADPGVGGGRWTALASGDSCLMQLRGDALLTAFPIASAAEFNSRPTLLSSEPASNAGLTDTLGSVGGEWLPGDRFYLLTDAAACWFLASYEAGEQPWSVLDTLAEPDDAPAFPAWVAGLRASRAIRNDDLTLLCVRV
jgi:hypothetical protein